MILGFLPAHKNPRRRPSVHRIYCCGCYQPCSNALKGNHKDGISVSIPQFAHLLLHLMANKTTFFILVIFRHPFLMEYPKIETREMETQPGFRTLTGMFNLIFLILFSQSKNRAFFVLWLLTLVTSLQVLQISRRQKSESPAASQCDHRGDQICSSRLS